MSSRPAIAVTALVMLLTTLPAGAAVLRGPLPEPVDCVGPVAEAEPGTPAWTWRDAENIWCAEQRLRDTALNQAFDPTVPRPLRDTYRDPADHEGVRFRFATATPLNRAGAELPTDIFLPCTAEACPEPAAAVHVGDGPYPAVLIVHGGASAREHFYWAAETLAESGYLVVTFDVAETSSGDHGVDAQDMVDWLLSADFPFADEVDPDRVGIAGHSQGASTASLLGQMDQRLKAIVAWDNLTATDPALWADDLGVDPPADLAITTPALGIGADYYFAPRPYTEPPEPAPSNGEGGRGRGFSAHPKDLGYQEVRQAGVDTMLFVLRAATHLDWVPFTEQAASRYGEAVSAYLTLAWFDRYLYGDVDRAEDAFRRLTATTFDDSADAHNISSADLDPLTGEVHHALLEGMPVCDRMSFYFSSRISISAPDDGDDTTPPVHVTSEDLRADCA